MRDWSIALRRVASTTRGEQRAEDAARSPHAIQPAFVAGSSALSAATFTALMEREQRAIQVFLRGLVSNGELALDLTQDVFQDAWRAAQQQKRPLVEPLVEEEARRWLFHTAYCKALSARRRWRLIRWESLDLATGPFGEYASYVEGVSDHSGSFEERLVENDALRTALARLAPQDAACLMLRVAQGFSAAEVGAIVGASPEVVTKRLSRAKQRLRAAYLSADTSALLQSPESPESPHVPVSLQPFATSDTAPRKEASR